MKVVALVVDDVDRVQVHCCSLFRVLMRHVSKNEMVQGAQIVIFLHQGTVLASLYSGLRRLEQLPGDGTLVRLIHQEVHKRHGTAGAVIGLCEGEKSTGGGWWWRAGLATSKVAGVCLAQAFPCLY